MQTKYFISRNATVTITGLTITVLKITDNNSIRDLYELIPIEISFYVSSIYIMFSVCLSVCAELKVKGHIRL